MGKIDQAISDNYQKALNQGYMGQAEKAVKIARILKNLIEYEGFVDYETLPPQISIGNGVFSPVSYKHDPETGTLILFKSTVSLTNIENRLLTLFSQNETHGESIKILTTEKIKNYLWPNQLITNNAVRILIARLRKKIEPNPIMPQILVNYNRKGYIFIAKKVA